MATWFGDFNNICFSACVPLPSCNLLRSNNHNVSLSGLASGAEAGQCLSGPTSNVRDYSTAVIVVLGIVFIVHRRLRRPFGMSSAVGTGLINHKSGRTRIPFGWKWLRRCSFGKDTIRSRGDEHVALHIQLYPAATVLHDWRDCSE
jgi:hypothetical protein